MFLWCAPERAWAQEGDPRQRADSALSIEIVSIRGAGRLRQGERPQIADRLRRFTEQLLVLDMATYTWVSEVARRVAPGERVALSLPLDHSAEVLIDEVEVGEVERLQISLEIWREPEPPEGERVQVLEAEILLREGQHTVINCREAFDAEVHLVLMVTAARD